MHVVLGNVSFIGSGEGGGGGDSGGGEETRAPNIEGDTGGEGGGEGGGG